MRNQLEAHTEQGKQLVELCEEHAIDFMTRAAQHDRENTFVAENLAAMRKTRVLAACVPEEYGGLGVTSVHDIMVAVSRLARGCASSAISWNMHVTNTLGIRRWLTATEAGIASAERRDLPEALRVLRPMRKQYAMFLTGIARYGAVLCGASTERGTAGIPYTIAQPTKGGYVLNGRKIFATNSDGASAISVLVRIDDGLPSLGMAQVACGTPGVQVCGNWDALGMRGSGSSDVVFENCFVPSELMQNLGPLCDEDKHDFAIPGLERLKNPHAAHVGGIYIITNNFPLIGTFLGIAEAARELAISHANKTYKRPIPEPLSMRPPIQHEVGELEIGLTAARSALDRTGMLIDELINDATFDEQAVLELESQVQCAKLVVNRAVADVVDRAMNIVGGGSYSAGHPLARHYRDLRAGPFMHPFSPIEAYTFIGRIALGVYPHEESDRAKRLLKSGSDAPVASPPVPAPVGESPANARPVPVGVVSA